MHVGCRDFRQTCARTPARGQQSSSWSVRKNTDARARAFHDRDQLAAADGADSTRTRPLARFSRAFRHDEQVRARTCNFAADRCYQHRRRRRRRLLVYERECFAKSLFICDSSDGSSGGSQRAIFLLVFAYFFCHRADRFNKSPRVGTFKGRCNAKLAFLLATRRFIGNGGVCDRVCAARLPLVSAARRTREQASDRPRRDDDKHGACRRLSEAVDVKKLRRPRAFRIKTSKRRRASARAINSSRAKTMTAAVFEVERS